MAPVTVPTAPSLKTTELLADVVSKPWPLIVIVARVGGHAGRALGNDRRHCGHLHRRAAVIASR